MNGNRSGEVSSPENSVYRLLRARVECSRYLRELNERGVEADFDCSR